MSWNSLVFLGYLNFKSLSWKVCNSKLDNSTFDFIKILTQIINNFLKAHQNKTKKFNLCQNGKVLMVM
jgi:hypothetical protein